MVFFLQRYIFKKFLFSMEKNNLQLYLHFLSDWSRQFCAVVQVFDLCFTVALIASKVSKKLYPFLTRFHPFPGTVCFPSPLQVSSLLKAIEQLLDTEERGGTGRFGEKSERGYILTRADKAVQ